VHGGCPVNQERVSGGDSPEHDRSGARVHRSLPTVAEEGEGDEAEP
jgi:hypothetical protein